MGSPARSTGSGPTLNYLLPASPRSLHNPRRNLPHFFQPVAPLGGQVPEDLRLDPRLPESWEGLSFQVTLRGTRVRVDLTQNQISFTIVQGERAEVSVRGHRVTVCTESPVHIPLSDQGPRIDGPVPSINGDRRPDGTLITPSVPQATTTRMLARVRR